MDDQRIGAAIRAVRLERRLRQADVATRARVTRITVSRLERGQVGRYSVDVVRRVTNALEMRLDLGVRWHGGDLDRVMNAAHAALHESVSRHLASHLGWTWAPEVTFAIYGERGVIDILSWHAASRSLLIIELKSILADPQDLVAVMDRRRRLAHRIASDHGWRPATVSVWVIASDTRTNRRRLAAHAALLRSAFPADGHVMRAWLRQPSGSVACLSFWTDDPGRIVGRTSGHPGTTRRRAGGYT